MAPRTTAGGAATRRHRPARPTRWPSSRRRSPALEADLAKAEAAGNEKKAADARAGIEARQSWLDEARKALTEFSELADPRRSGG